MTKVYVVKRHLFGRQDIIGVFSSQESAEQLAGRHSKADDLQVSTYELDALEEPTHEGLTYYEVSMERAGTGAIQVQIPIWDIGFILSTHVLPWRLNGYVWAVDPQRAFQMADEQRLQWIASGDWPEDEVEKDDEDAD